MAERLRLQERRVDDRLVAAWKMNFPDKPLTRALRDFIGGFVLYGWEADDYEQERGSADT